LRVNEYFLSEEEVPIINLFNEKGDSCTIDPVSPKPVWAKPVWAAYCYELAQNS
jgi:hypothetical protein